MIHQGKFFAKRSNGFVIFLLGMQVHNIWKVSKWWRIYQLIPRLLAELEQEGKSIGYLGSMARFSFRQPLIVQYWNSLDELHDFARNPARSHLEVWRVFNEVIGSSKDIGIWHETYVIAPHQHENIYINMPFTGLGQFTALQSIGPSSKSYKGRFEQLTK